MNLKKNKFIKFGLLPILIVAVVVYFLFFTTKKKKLEIYEVSANQIKSTKQYKGVLKPAVTFWYNAEFAREVIWRAETGASVKKGDVVLKFQSGDLEDEVESHQEGIRDKEATLAGIVLQNKSEISKAELETKEMEVRVQIEKFNYELAKDDPNELVRLEQELLLKKDLLRKNFLESKYKSSQELFAKGLVSENALQTAKVNFVRAESDYFKTNIKYKDRLAGVPQIRIKRLEKQLELAQKKYEDTLINEKNLREIHQMSELRIKEDIFTIGNKVARFKRNIIGCTVLAPFDGKVYFPSIYKGVMSSEPIEVGETPIKGVDILYFTNSSDYDVDFIVAETELQQIQVGSKINFVLQSNQSVKLDGEIFKISEIATDKNILLGDLALQKKGEANVKMIQISAHLKQSHSDLRQGITGTVTVQEEGKLCLTVPVNAVNSENGRYYVYNPKKEKIEIIIGRNDGFKVEVLSGLKAGDKIIYE